MIECAKCVERGALCVFSFSSLARHPERGSSSHYKHKEVQQHLHVQWGDHVTDALCRIHRGKSRCVSGRMHVFNGTLQRCCKDSPSPLWFCFKQCWHNGGWRSLYGSICLCLSRGTVGVLWSARMKVCGGWWASSAGAQAVLNPTILEFTPKLPNSWAGSMTWLRQTDLVYSSDQGREAKVLFPIFKWQKNNHLINFHYAGYFFILIISVLCVQS